MLDAWIARALFILAFADVLYFEPKRTEKIESAKFDAAVLGFLVALDMQEFGWQYKFSIYDLHDYIKSARRYYLSIKTPPPNDPLWHCCHNPNDFCEFTIRCMALFAEEYDLPELLEYAKSHEVASSRVSVYFHF